AVLDIRGRDVESAELAIEFDKQTCRWRLLGDAAEVHVSSQRAKIIAVLKEAGLAMTIPALMEATGMKRNPLEVLLGRMARQDKTKLIEKRIVPPKTLRLPPQRSPPRQSTQQDQTRQEQARHASPICRICPVIKGPDRSRDRSAASANAGNNRTK